MKRVGNNKASADRPELHGSRLARLEKCETALACSTAHLAYLCTYSTVDGHVRGTSPAVTQPLRPQSAHL
jgi:hypothetical protein